MDKELKACPCCHQPASPYGWKSAGCMNPDCMLTGMWFEWDIWQRKRAQLPSQGGEAVEVVGWRHFGDKTRLLCDLGKQRSVPGHYADEFTVPLMTVGQHQRILAAATHPADQVEDDLTMVKVSRELLQDLRDLAFDQVEHHRAAMGAYKQTRQSAMDSVLAQADALLRS